MTHWWETEQGHDSGPPKVPDLQSRGPGSIPGEDTLTALEPDGTATGCNPIEVGSTPTGVSDDPATGSDHIDATSCWAAKSLDSMSRSPRPT